MNMEFLCGVMKMFWKWIVAMVVQLCEYTENCFPGDSEVKVSAWNVGDPVQSLDWEDPLEKEMATHSSTLAWRIPWREEPGGLQSLGSQRVGHNWATSLSLSLSSLYTLKG